MPKSKTKLRNKADKLLQEYNRLVNKDVLCLLCREKTMTVGHHFIYKAQSNATRYYLPNIIPLCKDCHLYAHKWQNLFSTKMALKLGQTWYDDLEAKRKELTKTNVGWYELNIKILEDMTNELKRGRDEKENI